MTTFRSETDLTRWPCDHQQTTRGNDARTPTCMACGDERPAEDLTPEGVQLVIPGAERRLPPTAKQGELW